MEGRRRRSKMKQHHKLTLALCGIWAATILYGEMLAFWVPSLWSCSWPHLHHLPRSSANTMVIHLHSSIYWKLKNFHFVKLPQVDWISFHFFFPFWPFVDAYPTFDLYSITKRSLSILHPLAAALSIVHRTTSSLVSLFNDHPFVPFCVPIYTLFPIEVLIIGINLCFFPPFC